MLLRPRPFGGMRPQCFPVVNAGSPQARGLLAWWPVIRPNVSTRDATSFGWMAAPLDTTFSQAASPDCGISLFSDLNAKVDGYSVPSGLTDLLTTEATISAWIKLNEATPTQAYRTGSPIHIGGSASVSHYPYVDGVCYLNTFLTTRISFSPLASVNRADWHLLTVTAKPGSGGWVCYQNAQVAHTDTGDASIDKAVKHLVGSSGAFVLSGWIADVRIYRRALSAAEVYALYDPRTRWDLYDTSSRLWLDTVAAGTGAGPLLRGGSLTHGTLTRGGRMVA